MLNRYRNVCVIDTTKRKQKSKIEWNLNVIFIIWYLCNMDMLEIYQESKTSAGQWHYTSNYLFMRKGSVIVIRRGAVTLSFFFKTKMFCFFFICKISCRISHSDFLFKCLVKEYHWFQWWLIKPYFSQLRQERQFL